MLNNTTNFDRREGALERRDHARIPVTERRALKLVEALHRQLSALGLPGVEIREHEKVIFGLISFCHRHPRGIQRRDVESYMIHLIEKNGISLEQAKRKITAVRFLFENVYGRKIF